MVSLTLVLSWCSTITVPQIISIHLVVFKLLRQMLVVDVEEVQSFVELVQHVLQRSVSGSDYICSCSVAYSGSDVTNGVATCVEKTCTDSDGAGAAANCGSGASCSDGSVDDGYKVSEICY